MLAHVTLDAQDYITTIVALQQYKDDLERAGFTKAAASADRMIEKLRSARDRRDRRMRRVIKGRR